MMSFNQFSKNEDGFNNALMEWLKAMADLIRIDAESEQCTITQREHNPYMPFMQDLSFPQGISLQDFTNDIAIVLKDEFVGGITQISDDTLLIELPNDNIFRIKVIKDTTYVSFNGLKDLSSFKRFGDWGGYFGGRL